MNKEEILLEEKYLKKVLKEIESQKGYNYNIINSLEKQRKNLSENFSEDYYTMDDEEALTAGEELGRLEGLIDFSKQNIDKLSRQQYNPYFGRIDFCLKGKRKSLPYYIGVNNLIKQNSEIPLVCDWRAPVSSLFYDYELGDASYNAPDGTFAGKITLKRQYEIKNGILKNAFDSSLTIADDILKNVLSQKTSKKMKTIVTTIQKEQNKIIRNTTSKNILVQGVAGSGKTSIALHRIAFLLYQNKNTLKAEDILILSPNKLFSEYISDVLPELGEENISQESFYSLARKELKFIGLEFEKREDNINELITNVKRLNEVAYKNTYEFFESLQAFCKSYFDIAFKPKDLKFGPNKIKASELENLYYNAYKQKSPAVRIEWIVDYILEKLDVSEGLDKIVPKIKNMIYPFFENSNILKIYAHFLANIGMQLSLNEKEEVRYEDLGALLYITNYFFGLSKQKKVKYLVIDEMQDYSFVHFDVFNSIFDCNKTILGDINQCIEKIMSKDDLLKLVDMLKCEVIEMNKAYRSTYEIVEFANKIKTTNCKSVERHGSEPKVLNNDINSAMTEILKECENFNSIAILTKTKEEALEVYKNLCVVDNVSLNIEYNTDVERVCIMPSYMAKGLEFDAVVIPNYNKKNYKNTLDINLLYVSSTRALHSLYLLKSM